MSKSVLSARRTRVQKICTLWTHDDNFSRDDVVFSGDKFPELPATPGSLIQVVAFKYGTAVRDFQSSAKAPPKDASQVKADDSTRTATPEPHSRRSRRGSVKITLDENGSVIQEGREVDLEKSYVFVAKPFPAELKAKYPQLQVSIAEKIAKVFGLRNRMQVVVTLVSLHGEFRLVHWLIVSRLMKNNIRLLMWRLPSAMSISHEPTCGACQ